MRRVWIAVAVLVLALSSSGEIAKFLDVHAPVHPGHNLATVSARILSRSK